MLVFAHPLFCPQKKSSYGTRHIIWQIFGLLYQLHIANMFDLPASKDIKRILGILSVISSEGASHQTLIKLSKLGSADKLQATIL